MQSGIVGTNSQLKKLYETVYSEGKENFFTFPSHDCTAEVQRSIEWNGKSVLEIGCGEGYTAIAIAKCGATVTATDYAESAIKIAKEKHHHKNIQYTTVDYRDINKKFDVVVLQEVIEHMDHPLEDLSTIKKMLNESGKVVITCPSFLNMRGYIWMALQTLLNVPMSLSDKHFISPNDMKTWVRKINMKIEKMHSFRYTQSFGEGMVKDMSKRLRNALRDAKLDNSNVESFLEWCLSASEFEKETKNNGAKMLYVLTQL